MNTKLRTMRLLIGLAGALLLFVPSPAFAHDNLGGDELAATGWMLIAAFVVVLMGVFAGIWAFKSGQFTNVEEAANRMVEISDDYEAIMVAADERERAARVAAEQEAQKLIDAELAASGKKAVAATDRAAQAKL